MKKKLILHPFATIGIAMLVMILVGFVVSVMIYREESQIDKSSIYEQLEYHSSPDRLVIERDGLVIIKCD